MTEATQLSQAITSGVVIHLENGRSLSETLELPDNTISGEKIEFQVWIADGFCHAANPQGILILELGWRKIWLRIKQCLRLQKFLA